MNKRLAPSVAPSHYGPMAAQPVESRPDPTKATTPPVADSIEKVDRTTDTYTVLTSIGVPKNGQTPILYNGDRLWARVTVTLETAGPVAIGTRANLAPVLSGKGALLQTAVPVTFTIGKGSRLYYLAGNINRVTVQIEPVPWLEQITGFLSSLVKR